MYKQEYEIVGQISYQYETNTSMFTNMQETNNVEAIMWDRIQMKFNDECIIKNATVIKPTITETVVNGVFLIVAVSDIVLINK